MDSLCGCLVFLVACLAYSLRASLSTGLAGLAITYMMMIMDSTSWTVRMLCNLDSDSVAIERLREYDSLPQVLVLVPDSHLSRRRPGTQHLARSLLSPGPAGKA